MNLDFNRESFGTIIMQLTKNQLSILRVISKRGQSYPSEIARLSGQKRQNVNTRMEVLGLRGLVEAVDPPADWVENNPRQAGIVRFWRLTEKGKKSLNQDGQD